MGIDPLAAELTHIWPCVTNACAFLQRFGYFYRRHRAAIEHAARELRYVSEGLLALRQHEPLLFDLAMEAMGAAGLDILPKTAENRDSVPSTTATAARAAAPAMAAG